MDLRDLVLLLVPVMMNGVILFVFQQMLRRRNSRREKLDETQNALFKEYLAKLKRLLEVIEDEKMARAFFLDASERNTADKLDLSRQYNEKLRQTNIEGLALIWHCKMYRQVICADEHSRVKLKEFSETFALSMKYYGHSEQAKGSEGNAELLSSLFNETRFGETRTHCERLAFELMDSALAYLCGSELIDVGDIHLIGTHQQ